MLEEFESEMRIVASSLKKSKLFDLSQAKSSRLKSSPVSAHGEESFFRRLREKDYALCINIYRAGRPLCRFDMFFHVSCEGLPTGR